jgi:hypothetical protein
LPMSENGVLMRSLLKFLKTFFSYSSSITLSISKPSDLMITMFLLLSI